MSDREKLVVVVTNGFNDERASVAWSIANGGVGSGMQVTMFLVSSGVDWVRRGAAENARPNPLDPPMKDMIDTIIDSGGVGDIISIFVDAEDECGNVGNAQLVIEVVNPGKGRSDP